MSPRTDRHTQRARPSTSVCRHWRADGYQLYAEMAKSTSIKVRCGLADRETAEEATEEKEQRHTLMPLKAPGRDRARLLSRRGLMSAESVRALLANGSVRQSIHPPVGSCVFPLCV